jgi:steroid 5-alpha reductase family enzyme
MDAGDNVDGLRDVLVEALGVLKSARLTKASRGRSLRESAQQRRWRANLSSHEKSKRPVYVEL